MADALKRIEEKHKPCGCIHSQGGMAHECLCGCSRPGPECDFLKLARALDAFERGLLTRNEAKRTLEEVAGE